VYRSSALASRSRSPHLCPQDRARDGGVHPAIHSSGLGSMECDPALVMTNWISKMHPSNFPDNPSCWFRHIPSGAFRPSNRWCTCHRSICGHADHQTASLPTLHEGGSTTDDTTQARSCGRRVASRNMQPERHVISGRAIGSDLFAAVDLWGRPRIFLFALV